MPGGVNVHGNHGNFSSSSSDLSSTSEEDDDLATRVRNLTKLHVRRDSNLLMQQAFGRPDFRMNIDDLSEVSEVSESFAGSLASDSDAF
jgi:hypothetical protein